MSQLVVSPLHIINETKLIMACFELMAADKRGVCTCVNCIGSSLEVLRKIVPGLDSSGNDMTGCN